MVLAVLIFSEGFEIALSKQDLSNDLIRSLILSGSAKFILLAFHNLEFCNPIDIIVQRLTRAGKDLKDYW